MEHQMNKICFDLCWCRCTLYIQLLNDTRYTVALIKPALFLWIVTACFMVEVDMSEHQRAAPYLLCCNTVVISMKNRINRNYYVYRARIFSKHTTR